MIRLLTQNDLNTWLELAAGVEPLFGPMVHIPEFREGIKACIQNKEAFGIEDEKGILAGIVALDRQRNEISWLAVQEDHRGKNYGDRLVRKAIEELEANGDILVQTFSASIQEGKAARAIYLKNGFVELEPAGKNPAGIDTTIMVRKKSRELN